MLWNFLKTHQKIGFGTFSLVFVFALFFSFCLNTTNTFALEDLTVTLSPNTEYTANDLLFPNCDESCISQYLWFSFRSPGKHDNYNGRRLPLAFCFDSSSCLASNSYSLPLSDSPVWFTGFSYIRINGAFTTPSSSYQYILTLSEHGPDYSEPDCPVCEECEVCPAIPDNPYDDKFDRIIVAIYTVGGIMLVIYFLYGIYRMIIKSSRGGN